MVFQQQFWKHATLLQIEHSTERKERTKWRLFFEERFGFKLHFGSADLKSGMKYIFSKYIGKTVEELHILEFKITDGKLEKWRVDVACQVHLQFRIEQKLQSMYRGS